jgi:nitrogen fixation/metabolism regulation signal transduction histidine kinase
VTRHDIIRALRDVGDLRREAWSDVVAVRGSAPGRVVEDVAGADPSCGVDAFQVKRVFRNLFENSLAAGADEMHVRVRRPPTAWGEGAALALGVGDNRPGFAAEMRRRLFEPFFTTRTRGAGPGLATCRRIVGAHGGRIEAGADEPGAEVLFAPPRRAP